jgi:hypothetical protein
MRLSFSLLSAMLAFCLTVFTQPCRLMAQDTAAGLSRTAADEPPDAPQPQFIVAAAEPAEAQEPTGQSQSAQQPTQGSNAGQDSSSAKPVAGQTEAEKTRDQKAHEQIKEQEQQRVLGIMPAFNTSYRSDAVSLTAKEKISVAFRTAIDPYIFATALIVAGYGEVADSDSGFPWGAKGYGERAGAKYLDAFDGTMIGNGFLPALLRQDPRYFRLGHGTKRHRLLYSLATSFICKHDNTGKWEPNYSNVLGNIASGAVSNLYYPSAGSGFVQTIDNGMIVTGEGTVGAVLQEFWPDISRKLFHKDPTHGLDAQANAADKAAKQNKQN